MYTYIYSQPDQERNKLPDPIHRRIDFAWLAAQARNNATKEALIAMQGVRERFMNDGTYSAHDRAVVLHLEHARLATTLNKSYSTLFAYQETFRHLEHTRRADFASSGGVIVDIGANEGLYAIAMCNQNEYAEVYCIEANPHTARVLRRNIALNGYENRCHILTSAVWSQPKEMTLLALRTVSTSAALTDSPAKSAWLGPLAERIPVQAKPLDTILAPHNLEIAIMKIDIEGSEAEAIKGARETLSRTKRLVVEYHSPELRRDVRNLLSNDFTLMSATFDKVHGTPSCGNLYFVRKATTAQ